MSRLLLQANALRIPLVDRSVHCVVTSPPYWGLRDYGVDGQIGLEASPDLFVEHLVLVFREVRRVLRDDGTAWLNIGDTYATGAGKVGEHPGGGEQGARALALQADGWYLRSEIIWSKPNPMPESIRDRPSRSHETVFLLAKSERYFFDREAIKQPDGGKPAGNKDGFKGRQGGAAFHVRSGGAGSDGWEPGTGRNARSVLTIPTQPFRGSHFATMPLKLAAICIKAGTSKKGCCPACAAPWKRITKTEYTNPGNRSTNGPRSIERKHEDYGTAGFAVRLEKQVRTLGWRPTCTCGLETTAHCRVFDPFGGAGTTVLAAEALGRVGIMTELSRPYLEMAHRRLERPHSRPRPETPPEASAGPLFDRPTTEEP